MKSKKPETYFAKCRPVALAKEIRPPSIPVTTIFKARLPSVACHSELSINASYSQATTKPATATVPNDTMDRITPPTTNTTQSITAARKRCQNPAYGPTETAIGSAFAWKTL